MEAPDIGWIKVNFDFGCDIDSNQASYGGVVHDSNGSCRGWFRISKLGTPSSYQGELTAQLIAMCCARQAGWNHVIFEGDNREVINDIKLWIHEGSTPPFPAAKDIFSLRADFQAIVFGFVPRAINYLAHRIVKFINSPDPNLRLYLHSS